MANLSWAFELIDKMSGPASNIDRALSRLDGPMKSANQGLQQLDKTGGAAMGDLAGKVQSGSSKIDSSLKYVAGAATAAAAIGGALAVAGAAWVGKAIVFHESTTASLEALLGSKQAAEDVFAKAVSFSDKTAFQANTMAAAFEKLIASGTKVGDLDNVGTALANMAGSDTGKLNELVDVFGRIQSKGKLAGDELMSLSEKGLSRTKIIDALSQSLHKTSAEVENMLSAGQINAETGLGAIMSAINGTFGGRAEKAANTLEGLWSTLQSAPQKIFFSPEALKSIEDMIAPMRTFMKSLIDGLSPATDNGKKLIEIFTMISGGVGALFKGIAGGNITGAIGKVLDVVLPLVRTFMTTTKDLAAAAWPLLVKLGEGFGSIFSGKDALNSVAKVFGLIVERIQKMDPRTFEMIGKALGIVVEVIIGLWVTVMSLATGFGMLVDAALSWCTQTVDAVTWLVTTIEGLFTGIWDGLTAMFTEGGASMIQGLINGILGMMSPAGGAMASLGDLLIGAFKEKLGIASPSKVMAGFGDDTGQGFIQGLSASGIGNSIADALKLPSKLALPSLPNMPALSPAASAGAPNDVMTGAQGLFGNIANMLPMMGGSPLAAMAPAITNVLSPSPQASPLNMLAPAATNGQPSSFDQMLAAIGIGPASPAAPAQNAQNQIQPAAASGPAPGTAGNATTTNNTDNRNAGHEINIPGMSIVISEVSDAKKILEIIKSEFGSNLSAALTGITGQFGG